VQLSAEQRLVGIDVAHASEKALVQQQRLHHSGVSAQRRPELFEVELEGLWTELLYSCRPFDAPFDASELPDVVIKQYANIQRENRPRVRSGFAVGQ
jgi:hypothetical protein